MRHIRIDGTLNYRHHKGHIPHAFTVPDGTTKLSIRFDYEPKWAAGQPLPNQISLTLFDPHGARGARHCNDDQNITLTSVTASPGYIVGALTPGVWTAWIDTHRLLPPDVVRYYFEIDLSDEPITAIPQTWTKGSTAPRGKGWYRGDLHGHTLHSDAGWDVAEFAQYARDYRLDFVTLTDHNTVSPLAELEQYGADDLLTMGGMELTTYYGHALALGIREWIDWRTGLDGLTIEESARRARDAGALFIIAHPRSIGDPWCTGCDWTYGEMMPGSARCVEIWNGPWGGDSGNEAALQLWYGWLNEGYRMVATAGTDIHGPIDDPSHGFNTVYAESLTEGAILEAIRRGHLYISAQPRLALTARDDSGAMVMMGDIAPANVPLTLTWEGCSVDDSVRIIIDGQPHAELNADGTGKHSWTLDGRWTVVEIRSANGEMRAITNPIFAVGEWR